MTVLISQQSLYAIWMVSSRTSGRMSRYTVRICNQGTLDFCNNRILNLTNLHNFPTFKSDVSDGWNMERVIAFDALNNDIIRNVMLSALHEYGYDLNRTFPANSPIEWLAEFAGARKARQYFWRVCFSTFPTQPGMDNWSNTIHFQTYPVLEIYILSRISVVENCEKIQNRARSAYCRFRTRRPCISIDGDPPIVALSRHSIVWIDWTLVCRIHQQWICFVLTTALYHTSRASTRTHSNWRSRKHDKCGTLYLMKRNIFNSWIISQVNINCCPTIGRIIWMILNMACTTLGVGGGRRPNMMCPNWRDQLICHQNTTAACMHCLVVSMTPGIDHLPSPAFAHTTNVRTNNNVQGSRYVRVIGPNRRARLSESRESVQPDWSTTTRRHIPHQLYFWSRQLCSFSEWWDYAEFCCSHLFIVLYFKLLVL